MNRTRATLVWLSAAMKRADAIATHTATAMPAQPTDRNACTHAAALDDRDIRQQGGGGERGAAADLRRRVERELALEDAGGRPCDGGEGDIDLPAPLAPRLLQRQRRRRHAVN